jgi:alkylhydroperoxidase family enzyme
MARVPYLNKSDLAAENQELLTSAINLSRAMVHSPDLARSFGVVANFIRSRSRLDARLRELAILQVGYVTRAAYEFSHHVKLARQFGVADSDIRAIAQESAGRDSGLDPLTKAVLRAAREMTTGLTVSDEAFAILREHLDYELLLDLFGTIAFYNAVVRLLATLQIDVEDDFRKYLEEFPLPNS